MSAEGVRNSTFPKQVIVEVTMHGEGQSWVDTLSSSPTSTFAASGVELCLSAEVKPVRTITVRVKSILKERLASECIP